MPSPDPSSPPVAIRASATVLMVRDGPAGLEVFMIQRHAGSDVHGGSYVFPGGKVDAADAAPALHARLDLPPETLRVRLHEPGLDATAAAALHVAAVREAFEECRVLFADADAGTRARALAAPPAEAFDALLARLDLRLATAALRPFSRWITPENSVSSPGKRFDTRFFVAALPEGQNATHDNHEAVHSAWLRPRDALQRYWDGVIVLVPPQIMSLAQLSRAPDVATLLAQTDARAPHLVRPHVCQVDGVTTMAYPGDPLHAEATRVMPGPLRLFVRGRRFEPAEGFAGFCD
ncbi:NUDIX hydrolase [Xenophilus aerolatus]|nr:NUDIX hydrolase [Xenophilus aerolatus]